MWRAGFVLAGGLSTRMGRDKALLSLDGTALARRVAEEVRTAAGEVALLGDPSRYAELGYPVIADLTPGCGPAGGLLTALTVTHADWNLVAACDMPEVRRPNLERLFEAAEKSSAGCVVPRDAGGRAHPLCAVYHRSCLSGVTAAVSGKILKLQEIILTLRPLFMPAPDPAALRNLNTLEDWTCYTRER